MDEEDVPCQRWKPGRVQSWRRPSEGGFDGDRYAVAPVRYQEARDFIEARHYSGSYPADRFRFGLYDKRDWWGLAGVAVLSIPARREVLTKVFPGLMPYRQSLELGRFCLDDSVPANGETWFLARVWRLARELGIRGVVSFSDPLRRVDKDGTVVFRGHIGTIYAAGNAVYTGRGTPRTLTVLRDGFVLSDRARAKILAGHSGHQYAEELLTSRGARPRRPGEDPAAWLPGALDSAGAKPVDHLGCHRYAFPLGPVEVGLPSLPYPKQLDAA